MQSFPEVPRQDAVRSEWLVLYKDCNAVLVPLGNSLRASQKAAIHVVATLGKGITITCESRLAANRFLTRCRRQYHLEGVLV